MKAVVSITLDNEIAIHDIKIIEGNNRLFAAMPSRKAPDGSHKDIVHPICESGRRYFEEIIMKEYNNFLKNNELGGANGREE